MRSILLLTSCLIDSDCFILCAESTTHWYARRQQGSGLSTEIRHLTLLDYFLNTRAAEDVPYAAVGTSPYASYYARTGAFEVFILAAGMCVIGRIVQPSTSRKK